MKSPLQGALALRKETINGRFEGKTSCEKFNGGSFSPKNITVLEKKCGRDFVILNLSDPHFSDYDMRAVFALEAAASVKRLVSEIKPDLITVTGDMVCGASTVHSIKRFTDLMESTGVPWAPVFGNHDEEGNCDKNYLADIMLSSPRCLLKKGAPEMGVGNYIVCIAKPGTNGRNEIIEALIMMDSHRAQPNEKQAEWLIKSAAGIKGISPKAEISLMLHIPLPEYQYAYTAAWDNSAGAWRNGFAAAGELHESICCERENGVPVQRGFFNAIKETGSTKFIFCGHEHMNNFSILYEGVRLTYTMKLGFGSGFQPGFNGGTVIRVSDNGISTITHRTLSRIRPIDIVNIKI